MKRIQQFLFLSILLFLLQPVMAQQLNEDFESSTFPPVGWTNVHTQGSAVWEVSLDRPHSGNKSAHGQFEGNVSTPVAENFLITPKIYSIQNTDKLSFWVFPQFNDADGGGFFDTLYVLVSTTDNQLSSFTDTLMKFATYTLSGVSYTNFQPSLSAYTGQDIFIAFRHYQTQGVGIYLDDVSAGSPLANDIVNEGIKITPSGIVATNTPVTIVDTIKNGGTFQIPAGISVRYSVNGVLQKSITTPSPINVGNSTTVSFTGANAFTPTAPGTYLIKVYADYGAEQNRSNDTIAYTLTVQTPINTFPSFTDFTTRTDWTQDGGTALWKFNSLVYTGVMTPVINPAGKNDVAAVMNNYNSTGEYFYLRSPLLNFTGISKPMLNFYVAYRTENSGESDQLQVLVSVDGGATYNIVPVLYQKSYITTPSLSTMPPESNGKQYVPVTASEWRHEIIDLSSYAGQPNVLIAFKGTSGGGNNVWVDNVNIISQNPLDYAAERITTVNQVATGPFNTKVTFNSLPNVDSIRFQGHSFQPASNTFESNTTATSTGGTIETPNFIFDRFTTIAFSGNAIARANYDISIDITDLNVDPSDVDKLYIMKRSDQSGDWKPLTTTRAGNIVTATGLTSFSDFAVGFYAGPLPLTLLDFDGHLKNNKTHLNWRTANEKNVAGFEVERKTNGNWINIGYVTANGTSSENTYSFIDGTTENGVNYYRLKMIDKNDHYNYSEIVSVNLKLQLSKVYQNVPNPFTNITTIKYEIAEKAPVKIIVYDINGSRLALLENSMKPAGVYEATWNAGNLPAGNYFYKVIIADKVVTKKMLKVQ